MPRARLTLAQARRVALASSGFDRARTTGPVDRRTLLALVRRLGLLQIDSVNVLTRAHYLPAFSRLGPYERALLDDAAGRAPRALFEYWGHEASLLPVTSYPLLRWRMERVHQDAWGGIRRVATEHPELVAEVAAIVRERGPLTATQLEAQLAHAASPTSNGWGWNWSLAKRALEYLFWSGEVTSAGRDAAFRRKYADPAGVLPRSVLAAPVPSAAEAQVELVRIAARALGVATGADLADYFRLPPRAAHAAVAELVSAGELIAVDVPGWPAAYLRAGASVPRELAASALLVPFDPLIWTRQRAERLFGMRYRVEMYVPAGQRQYGYYVLPFLFGDELVARVDLKAERREAVLWVRAAHGEAAITPAAIAALAAELRSLGAWLGLGEVRCEPLGDLSEGLRRALR